MTDYVYRAQSPYSTYLEAGARELSSGAWGRDDSAGERQKKLVGEASPAAPAGVAFEVQEWHSGVEGVDVAFHWGLCECLLGRGQFSAPLETLKRSARSSAQRWAAEQFDAARDEFRRGHLGQSLEHLQRALTGQDAQPGDPHDYRALFLLGLLRLGSFGHRDPHFMDLAAAEDAFLRAGRYAAPIQPTDAAWAYTAAAWAAYCNGRPDDALAGVRTALALRTKFGEAQYLAAKILMRQGQAESAAHYLGSAIAIHPVFARRAVSDADFASSAGKVDQAVASERLRAGERAAAALKPALERAVEIGVLEADQRTAVALPPGSGAGNAARFLAMAQTHVEKNTLFGFVEAEAFAALATQALNAAILHSKADKRALEQGVRQAERAIEKLEQFESGESPLGSAEAKELKKAQNLLADTAAAVKAATLREFLLNYEPARTALAAALQALENCKSGAIEEANAKRLELDRELNRSAAIEDGGGGYVGKGVCFGFIAALIPTMCTSFSTSGGLSLVSGGRDAAFRFIVLAVATSAIGAVFGLLAGPLAHSSAAAQRLKLESARAALEDTIDQLGAVLLPGSGR